jgi:hypothetical protein
MTTFVFLRLRRNWLLGTGIWLLLLGSIFSACASQPPTLDPLLLTIPVLETQNMILGTQAAAYFTPTARVSPTPMVKPQKTPSPGRNTVTPTRAADTATPTVAYRPGLLAARLYFISGLLGGDAQNPSPDSYQIWRLETDGQTTRRLTTQTLPVMAFDLSPADGSLAYITGNQLLLADANGTVSRVLVAGEPLPAKPDLSFNLEKQLFNVVWSPDGQKLAYGLNGVNVLDLSSGKSTPLLVNQVPPDGQAARMIRYLPLRWSPDGSTLVVSFAEDTLLGLLPADGGDLITPGDRWGCCTFDFSPDGQLLVASPGGDQSDQGVWLVNPQTGDTQALQSNLAWMFSWPKVITDTSAQFLASSDEPDRFRIVRAELTGLDTPTQLAKIVTQTGVTDVLWSPDGAQVVVAYADQPLELFLPGASAPIPLKFVGKGLRWQP